MFTVNIVANPDYMVDDTYGTDERIVYELHMYYEEDDKVLYAVFLDKDGSPVKITTNSITLSGVEEIFFPKFLQDVASGVTNVEDGFASFDVNAWTTYVS